MCLVLRWLAVSVVFAGPVLSAGAACAQALAIMDFRSPYPAQVFEHIPPQTPIARTEPDDAELPAHLRRQIVAYSGPETTGTVIIDTPNTYLYYVLGGGRAVRYAIGVGREGFSWSGVQSIAKKSEWPDWHPPADMIARQPYLPRFMAGGPGNPLGARALYLGNTVYRIHGTNAPATIGMRVSSGCIRMLNADVVDLYQRVGIGAKVVVLPDHQQRMAVSDNERHMPPLSTAPVIASGLPHSALY